MKRNQEMSADNHLENQKEYSSTLRRDIIKIKKGTFENR